MPYYYAWRILFLLNSNGNSFKNGLAEDIDKVWIESEELSTGIAWYLAQRMAEMSESNKLSEELPPHHIEANREGGKRCYGVRLKPLQMKCHKVCFPAYILDYSFGTTERNGKWVTQNHTALVNGITGKVYAQSHLCPNQTAGLTFLVSTTVMTSLSILPYWSFVLPLVDSVSLSQGALFTAAASCTAYAGAWHQNFQVHQKVSLVEQTGSWLKDFPSRGSPTAGPPLSFDAKECFCQSFGF